MISLNLGGQFSDADPHPPEIPQRAVLFRNRDLMGTAVTHDAAKGIVRAPVMLGFAVTPSVTPFTKALLQAGAYRFKA